MTHQALVQIQQLYLHGRDAQMLSEQERQVYRQYYMQPILDKFYVWLQQQSLLVAPHYG